MNEGLGLVETGLFMTLFGWLGARFSSPSSRYYVVPVFMKRSGPLVVILGLVMLIRG